MECGNNAEMNDVREDESYSDSDDETRATKFGDNDETDGGREDDSNSDSDDERACTYIGDMNYVALMGAVERTRLR